MKIDKKTIKNKLKQVLDPELGISIVDLGLIYEIKIEKEKVKIVMTLTTIGCPLFSLIEEEVKNRLKELGLKEEEIELELTFDPPWTLERMSKEARAMLGI
jgi:metal-sulfur cluster biosynthetic enzyme